MYRKQILKNYFKLVFETETNDVSVKISRIHELGKSKYILTFISLNSYTIVLKFSFLRRTTYFYLH